MKARLFILLSCVFVVFSVSAEPVAVSGPGVAVTIYTDNFAVVRESRQMDFEQGVNTIRFTGVASSIDPTSVNFKCLSAPDAVSILEQNYEYDLVSTNSLLKRYIDREVTILVKGAGADRGREVSGVLLAAVGRELILKSESNNIEIIGRDNIEDISLKELPEDLVTQPTLVWLAEAKQAGRQLCQTTYMTGAMGWHADYSAVLSSDETKLDFSGWVTIQNNSGTAYKDAGIKLIAGDVRRITEPSRRPKSLYMMEAGVGGAPAFEEKAFMEYHLYTLGRKSTINNNQIKQIEFIEPAVGVAVEKLFLYERRKLADKVQVKLEFANTRENNLGIALPKGKVRVFKMDPADDSLEFVGEDKIDHTPRKEKLSLYIGNAFDVVPEYTRVDSKRGRRSLRQTHKVEIRNRKEQAITVFVDEKFNPWVNWMIDESTHEYEKRDARTARFTIELEADSTVTVEYTATEKW